MVTSKNTAMRSNVAKSGSLKPVSQLLMLRWLTFSSFASSACESFLSILNSLSLSLNIIMPKYYHELS